MAKMTRKYSAAVELARRVGVPVRGDQEDVYEHLARAGFQWDSKAGEWIRLGDVPADEPTELIRIRIWSDAEVIEEAADLVQGLLKKKGFHLVERSKPYICRPPKQLEARIYLAFLPRGKDGAE